MVMNDPLARKRQTCQQHERCNVTIAVSAQGTLAMRSRQHGQSHQAAFDIHSLVRMLDPRGTSYRPV